MQRLRRGMRPTVESSSGRCLWPLSALLALALAWPAGASAETRTFLNLQGFGPVGNGGTSGPANNYPGTVRVAGVGGTVTKVSLTVIQMTANADLDMALVGPNGAQVMLMSDACSSDGVTRQTWTFEDSAPTFVSSGSCPAGAPAGRLPTNYEPEADDLSLNGGPVGPFGNSLAAFNGISPDGDWKLFLLDDSVGNVGFFLPAFALQLEVTPPPPPPPTIVTVQVPVEAKPTGKRARALAKCKTKPTKEARKRCRTNARKLPA